MLALTLGACAHRGPLGVTDPQARWAQRQADLVPIESFTVSGRVAGGGLLAPRADYRWTQQAQGRFELRLSGPFGVGATTLVGDDAGIEVRTPQGVYQSDAPQQWAEVALGWRLPIARLRRWILGLPATDKPEQLELDSAGRLARLVEDGWTLNYLDYAEHGSRELPRRIEASNGEVTVKLLADRWDGLP